MSFEHQVYTREKQLEILQAEIDKLQRFVAYEMHTSIGTPGERDIIDAGEKLMRASKSFFFTVKMYANV